MSLHLVLHWRRFAIALHKRVVQSGITVIHDICFPLKHLLPEAEVLHRYLIVALALQDKHRQRQATGSVSLALRLKIVGRPLAKVINLLFLEGQKSCTVWR